MLNLINDHTVEWLALILAHVSYRFNGSSVWVVILLLFAAAAASIAADHFQNRVFNVSGGWMVDRSKSTMKKHTLYKLNDRTDFNILYPRQAFFLHSFPNYNCTQCRSRKIKAIICFDRLWRLIHCDFLMHTKIV